VRELVIGRGMTTGTGQWRFQVQAVGRVGKGIYIDLDRRNRFCSTLRVPDFRARSG
jgi:hypothetical protein